MKEPRWLDRRAITSFHLQSLAEHGGSLGIRDAGLLDSALARPRNQFAYATDIDIAKLAAAYGFALAKNHAFIDGNKRVGANAAITFLLMNDWEPLFDEAELVDLVLSVASGVMAKSEVIQMFEKRCRRISGS